MPLQVCATAACQCSFGTGPSTLLVTSQVKTVINNLPAATIMDFAPITNIPPFIMCTTLSNPQVAAATAAKLGVFTPFACLPVTNAPWMPGSPTVLVQGLPALHQGCTTLCQWGGVISITSPGQLIVNVP